MPKEAPEISSNQRSFILEAIRKNVRLDGRGFDQFRPLDLSFGSEHGHVRVKLGKTRYGPILSS
jgi:exosome complex component RRP45